MSDGPRERAPSALHVAENRASPLLAYALIGLPLALPGVIGVLPEASMSAVLAFVGVEGVLSTQLFWRVLLLLRDGCSACCPSARTIAPVRVLSFDMEGGRVHAYTLVQLLCYLSCAGLFLASKLSGITIDLAVGILVAFVIPLLRSRVLTCILTPFELRVLDSPDEEGELLRMLVGKGGARAVETPITVSSVA